MKQIVKKSCFTLELRIGFLIVCIVSLVVFGLLGSAFYTIAEMILRMFMKQAMTNPSSMELLICLSAVIVRLNYIIRGLGFLMFVSSVVLLLSWFQMNKYAGTGPDAGMFSCFAAVNPMNMNKRKQLKWWMLPWVVCEGLFFLAMVFMTLSTILDVSALGTTNAVAIIVPPLAVIVIGLIQAYCVIVVVSYYVEQTASSI